MTAERSRCGARTRQGGPCRRRPVPHPDRPRQARNGRCRLHGGLSTGPRTTAGRERLRQAGHARYLAAVAATIEAQRRRALEAAQRAGLVDAMGYAEAEAAYLRRRHEEHETTIARYLAAGRTRAFACRMLRLAARGIRHPRQLPTLASEGSRDE